MKTLWAPWRMEYVSGESGKGKGCFLCAARNTPHSRDELLLASIGTARVFLNRFPYAHGHLLIAPARHAADICDLSDEETCDLVQTIRKSVTILRKRLQPHGFNIGLNLGKPAGAGIAEHLHWHVIPRWEGDHNFTAVIGEIRVIPEHISNTYDLLVKDFENPR